MMTTQIVNFLGSEQVMCHRRAMCEKTRHLIDPRPHNQYGHITEAAHSGQSSQLVFGDCDRRRSRAKVSACGAL